MTANNKLIRVLLLIALPVGGVVALSSCGDGDGGHTASGAPTKSQLIKRADAICRKGAIEKERGFTAAVEEGALRASRRGAEQTVRDVILSPYAKTVSQLAALNPPAKDEADIERIIQAFETALREAEANPAEVITSNPFAKANEAAVAYGLEYCRL
jgi:uncharacterized protein with LGFP repeats